MNVKEDCDSYNHFLVRYEWHCLWRGLCDGQCLWTLLTVIFMRTVCVILTLRRTLWLTEFLGGLFNCEWLFRKSVWLALSVKSICEWHRVFLSGTVWVTLFLRRTMWLTVFAKNQICHNFNYQIGWPKILFYPIFLWLENIFWQKDFCWPQIFAGPVFISSKYQMTKLFAYFFLILNFFETNNFG